MTDKIKVEVAIEYFEKLETKDFMYFGMAMTLDPDGVPDAMKPNLVQALSRLSHLGFLVYGEYLKFKAEEEECQHATPAEEQSPSTDIVTPADHPTQ